MMLKQLYFMVILLLTQSTFAAAPAFEAYYKFILGGVHSGYVIQRFEIDNAKNEMTSMYYTYVKTPTGTTTESLVAISDLTFEPKSYQYTALVDGKIKSIDATFKNKKMTAKIIDDKKTQTVSLTVPANGFMSTFLNYVVLKNGMTVGKSYEFYALAEESPACLRGEVPCDSKNRGFIKGTALVESEQKMSGIPSFKLKINYKGIDFLGYVAPNGETLGSVSPLQDASTEIVATREEAVGEFPFKINHVKTVFGEIPLGVKNYLHVKPVSSKSNVEPQSKPRPETKPSPSYKENSTTESDKINN